MKIIPVGELKTNFSSILHDIKSGEEITISYGRKKEKVAVILSYKKYYKRNRILGLLKDKSKVVIEKDFNISDEEFLKS